MAYVLPLVVPASLVERGVVPGNDFSHTHLSIAFGPDSRGYVASDIFYNFSRYADADDRDLSSLVVTCLGSNFSIERVATLEALREELTTAPEGIGESGHVFHNDFHPIAVTAAGEVVFTTTKNRTAVLDASLESRVATYDPLRGGPKGLSDVVVLPSGALVGARDHKDLVAAAVTPSLRDGMPKLRKLGSILEHGDGLEVVDRIVALDEDRILVSMFRKPSRAGWSDHDAFAYAILDGSGSSVARLPLGAADSPYRPAAAPFRGAFANRPLGGWVTRSEAAFHLFDRNGARTTRIGVDDGLAAIATHALLGIGPAGELVLVHRKHHTLTITSPVTSPADLAPALADAASVYRSEYGRLKKAVRWVDGRFLGHETHTALATGAKAKKRAPAPKKSVELPMPVLAPVTNMTPETSLSRHPFDLDGAAVYGDWLEQKSDPLGEYVSVCTRLARPGEVAPSDRRRLSERAVALRVAHERRWRQRWNAPLPLFEEDGDTFAGLPSKAEIDAVPKDIASLDRQLERLPVQQLVVSQLKAAEVMQLAPLAALHRVPGLKLVADSKHKLGRSTITWLAQQRFTALERLELASVSVKGADVQAILDSMPSLRELRVYGGGMTAEAVRTMSLSAAAARIEKLDLASNPLGSHGLRALSAFTSLRVLELTATDLGDDLADAPVVGLPIKELDIEDNERIGARGLQWLVASAPKVEELRIGDALPSAAIDVLSTIAGRLEVLETGRPRDVERMLAKVIAKAECLYHLSWNLGGRGEIDRILGAGRLRELALFDTTDADVAALAASDRAAALEEVYLFGSLGDKGLMKLAGSRHLARVRKLWVYARNATEKGIGALLDALPGLEELSVAEASIRSAKPLCVQPAKVWLELDGKIPKDVRIAVEKHWGRGAP